MQTSLPDSGYALIVKRDCPTCELIVPVAAELVTSGLPLHVYSQDDPGFPESVSDVVDDRELFASWKFQVETVPSLIRIENGAESARAEGWHRGEWRALTGVESIGTDLPEQQPGCGSMSVDPGMVEELMVRYGDSSAEARPVTVTYPMDPVEACFDRGWSDGLPVVPPTEVRLLRMLEGTSRKPNEVIGDIPPSMAPCTVEKAALNAVMAGCKPEYFPIVLAAIEAVLEPEFSMHGVLCTTDFVGPWVIVNGPMAKRAGMNSGVNALGQGNRANATIGRALQLVIRNVGGGRPGEIDRSTLGQPGKYTACFAEAEDAENWTPLATRRGVPQGKSAVTVFAGAGVQPIWDERSRVPESLAMSFAQALCAIGHPKRFGFHDAMLVISPDHQRIFSEHGWDPDRIREAVIGYTARPAAELARGAGGNAEGLLPAQIGDAEVINKFSPTNQLLIVRAGGPAGLISAIISGWAASGERGSSPVTKEISV